MTRFKLRNAKPGLSILNFTKQAADGKWVTTKSKVCTQKKLYAKHLCTDNSVHCVVHFQLHFELLYCNSYIPVGLVCKNDTYK